MSNNKRFFLLTATCGTLGIIVGVITSQVAIDQCFSGQAPTEDCLISDFSTLKLKNITVGFVAGVGAAIGASWNVLKQDN